MGSEPAKSASGVGKLLERSTELAVLTDELDSIRVSAFPSGMSHLPPIF